MQEKQIPSLLLNIMFNQVIEQMGRRSLNLLLRRAGLPQYIDRLPALDDSPTLTVPAYSQLLADIYDMFGPQPAQSLFLQSGRLAADELRRQQPARVQVAGTALKLLPVSRRLQIVLDQLADLDEQMYGVPYRLHEDSSAFFLNITDCVYCAEITRRSHDQGGPPGKPVCHLPVGILAEMVEWATGERHLIEEITCIAQGATACRFRIAK